MAGDFIPKREAELVTWGGNLKQLLGTSPTDYGLTIEQAAAYGALYDEFVLRYGLASHPNTRTRPNISAKNDAKAAMIANIRELARIVQATPTVGDQAKLDLGLPVHKTEHTPVPPPSDAPNLDIVSVTGRTVTVRLHGDAGGRGKPEGIDGATLVSWVGETPPDDINDWKFEGSTSRTTFDITFDPPVPAGSKVWLAAFWFSPRKQSGPVCPPVETYIGGGLNQAA